MESKTENCKRSHNILLVLSVLLLSLLLNCPTSTVAGLEDIGSETEAYDAYEDTSVAETQQDPVTIETNDAITTDDQPISLEEPLIGTSSDQILEENDSGESISEESSPTVSLPVDPGTEVSEALENDPQNSSSVESTNETEGLPEETSVDEEAPVEFEEVANREDSSPEIASDKEAMGDTDPLVNEIDNPLLESKDTEIAEEDEDLQISLQSLETTIKAKAAPQYEIRAIDGNLYIVNIHTNEIRKDNAWVEINGKHYFPNAEGKLYQNRWITFGPKFAHYMGGDGVAYTGVRQVNNNLHLFDDINYQRGLLRKDNAWVEYNGKEYFPNAEGKLYHDQVISFGPAYLFYLDSDGSKFNGEKVVQYNNDLYLFGDAGKPKTPSAGWHDIEGKHYYANAHGKFYRNQWIKLAPDTTHYIGSDGAAYTGVKSVGKNLHLFDNTNLRRGALRKDNAWVKYNGKEYFPNHEGKLYHDQIISFGPNHLFYLGSDGSKFNGNKVVHYGDQILLFGNNGRAKTPQVGWYDSDNKHYFANEQGKFYRNQWITFGPSFAFYMGPDGATYTGVRSVGSNLHLFDGRNMRRGVLRKDNTWVEYEGKDYYPRYDGKLYRNQVVTSSNGTLYYVDGNGSKLNSNKIVRYNNRLYMFGKGSTVQKLNNWVSLDGSRYFVTYNGTLHTKSIRMINGQEYLFDANGRSSLTNSGYRYTVKLSTPWSSQLTPIYAPNGCEMASALGALRYHGYDRGISLATLLAEMPRHPNPQYGFNTNPYGTALGTIYPNALLPSLQKYAPNSVDISWSTIAGWRREIDNGNPVVLWCTSGFRTPYYGGLSYPSNTHVQLITGYSAENNTFAVMDPYTWSSSASFRIVNSYTLANSNAWGGRYAIAIR